MKKLKSLALALLSVAALTVTMSRTVDAAPSRMGKFLVGSSAGFSVISSETFFATDLSADYFFHPNISIGYEMLMLVGDAFLWGNQAVGKYTFDIHNSTLNNLKPFIEMLMGFGIASNGDTEATFLGGFGWGADYFVDSQWALGTNMIFDFGNEVFNKNFAFIWKVIEFKYLF